LGGVSRPSSRGLKCHDDPPAGAGLQAGIRAVALWIAAGANLKEVSVRAGHTSVAFTLDRYGHLFPGHDDELRDRLDAMHPHGLQAVPGGAVVELPAGPGAARRGPSAAHGNASNEEGPPSSRV
jgi:hypothetical protein